MNLLIVFAQSGNDYYIHSSYLYSFERPLSSELLQIVVKLKTGRETFTLENYLITIGAFLLVIN